MSILENLKKEAESQNEGKSEPFSYGKQMILFSKSRRVTFAFLDDLSESPKWALQNGIVNSTVWLPNTETQRADLKKAANICQVIWFEKAQRCIYDKRPIYFNNDKLAQYNAKIDAENKVLKATGKPLTQNNAKRSPEMMMPIYVFKIEHINEETLQTLTNDDGTEKVDIVNDICLVPISLKDGFFNGNGYYNDLTKHSATINKKTKKNDLLSNVWSSISYSGLDKVDRIDAMLADDDITQEAVDTIEKYRAEVLETKIKAGAKFNSMTPTIAELVDVYPLTYDKWFEITGGNIWSREEAQAISKGIMSSDGEVSSASYQDNLAQLPNEALEEEEQISI